MATNRQPVDKPTERITLQAKAAGVTDSKQDIKPEPSDEDSRGSHAQINGEAAVSNNGKSCNDKTPPEEEDDSTSSDVLSVVDDDSEILGCGEVLEPSWFSFQVNVDIRALALLALSLVIFLWRLRVPHHVVFDEVHIARFVNFYLGRLFFLDTEPPLGKLVLAAVAGFTGYDGQHQMADIGQDYTGSGFPYVGLRMVTALCGSLLPLCVYLICQELGLYPSVSLLAGLFILLDTSWLTQSRYFMLDSMMMLSTLLAVFAALRTCRIQRVFTASWFLSVTATGLCAGLAISIKHTAVLSVALVAAITLHDLWRKLPNKSQSMRSLAVQLALRLQAVTTIPLAVFFCVYYVHFAVVTRSGPHDALLTDELKQTLAGSKMPVDQTLYRDYFEIAYGSQIMLEQSPESVQGLISQHRQSQHKKAPVNDDMFKCWLHSHTDLYPMTYDDGRNSSHQQQITCYPYKDVNNWWLVKRPGSTSLGLDSPAQIIKDGDYIELVHSTTRSMLNSHNVAGPVTKFAQEVSGYSNDSFPGSQKWKVDIVGEDTGTPWRASRHDVRLLHDGTDSILAVSGERLPEWGFQQMEVIAALKQVTTATAGTLWRAAEHQHAVANTADPLALSQNELQRSLTRNASQVVHLNFFSKLYLYQMAVLKANRQLKDEHDYATAAMDWPQLNKGVAYWMSNSTNAQVYLVGNPVLWYSATAALLAFPLLCLVLVAMEVRLYGRCCHDQWREVSWTAVVLYLGWFVNFFPFLCYHHLLFLHHYLPALVFKLMLLAALINHAYHFAHRWMAIRYAVVGGVCVLLLAALHSRQQLVVLSHGNTALTNQQLSSLQWRDSWEILMHTPLPPFVEQQMRYQKQMQAALEQQKQQQHEKQQQQHRQQPQSLNQPHVQQQGYRQQQQQQQPQQQQRQQQQQQQQQQQHPNS